MSAELPEMHCQPKTIDPRPCKYCGTIFTPARPWGRFHADDCRNKWHQKNPNVPNPLESDDEFSMTLMNPNPSFKARKDGDHYFVDFELSKEEWEWFTDPNIDRTGMVLELTAMVTHRAIKISAVQESKPKGGQLAQEAGKICSNPQFQLFLQAKYSGVWRMLPPIQKLVDRPAQCVRDICGVTSRSQLDSNQEAKRKFMGLMHEFSVWSLERT